MRKSFIAATAALVMVAAAGVCRAEVKLAVANPVKILNELAETKEINKAMESEQATFRQQVAEREQKVKDVLAQRDALKTGTPQWEDLNKQFVSQKNEAQTWAQTTQMDLARKFREQAKRMNDKITATIGEVAKAKSIDLVVAEQKPEANDQQVEQMNPQQVMQYLFARNILYKNDAIDITQEVIAKLDATYKK